MRPTTKRSGAELRQAAAVKEAIRREHSFLSNLAGAQDDYEWIVEREAWTDLGHDTFADWWEARVQPTMRALSMRPTRALADKVVEKVRADEAGLPPAQRRTNQELADLAGVHPDTLSGRKRQDPHQAEVPPTDDLDGSSLVGPEMPAGQEFADAALAEIDQLTSAPASGMNTTDHRDRPPVETPPAAPHAGVDELSEASTPAPDHRDRTPGVPEPDPTGPASGAEAGAATPTSAPPDHRGDTPGEAPTATGAAEGPGPDKPAPSAPDRRAEAPGDEAAISSAAPEGVGSTSDHAPTPSGPPCEACGDTLPIDTWQRGFMQCADCDPDGRHVLDDNGDCRGCAVCPTCGKPRWSTDG
jgi:hypothetical protein